MWESGEEGLAHRSAPAQSELLHTACRYCRQDHILYSLCALTGTISSAAKERNFPGTQMWHRACLLMT